MTDIEMIQDPDRWPNFPLLPLVRGNEAAFITCASLTGKLMDEIWLWRGNMFDAISVVADLKNRVVYENAEAVIADGWRVD